MNKIQIPFRVVKSRFPFLSSHASMNAQMCARTRSKLHLDWSRYDTTITKPLAKLIHLDSAREKSTDHKTTISNRSMWSRSIPVISLNSEMQSAADSESMDSTRSVRKVMKYLLSINQWNCFHSVYQVPSPVKLVATMSLLSASIHVHLRLSLVLAQSNTIISIILTNELNGFNSTCTTHLQRFSLIYLKPNLPLVLMDSVLSYPTF